MKKQLLLSLLAACFAQPLLAQPDWTPARMMAFKRVGSPVISPDGQRVAYVVGNARMDAENSDFLTHIYVVGADGKANAQFTVGDKSCTNPKFSPDGLMLAFTSARGKDGKTQLYVLRLAGGEAEPITTGKGNVSNYGWSPDSKQIAFTMVTPRSEQEEKDRKERHDWDVVDRFQTAQLHLVTLTKTDKNQYPTRQLTTGAFHVTTFDWSPDGKTIVFGHQTTPSADAWSTSDISLIASDGGDVRPLVTGKGGDMQPLFSHDGRQIAFVSDGGTVSWMQKEDVYVIPATGGTARKLATTPDEMPQLVGWSPDDTGIILGEAYRTRSSLYALPTDGSPAKRLTLLDKGVYGGYHVNKRGDVTFTYQTTETPPDVYVASLTDMTARKLTDIHAGYMTGRPVAKTDLLTWKSKDGKYDIDGLLTYPANYQPGRQYPLVLNVHGGPAGAFAQTYTGASGVYPIQALARQGYFVLRPNPRGSGAYGADFRRANYRDWGNNDYNDLMAGVDKTIALGLVHADSLVETGWSYGGYMTSMIITKTNRFKAVMAGAPVTNLMSFNGTADIAGFLPSYFGGEFWDDPKTYAEHSAMFNIKTAKTPTLIVHGLADERVPPEQGFQLHRALQRLGVKTKMVTYPRQPHGFVEPKFIQDVGERVIDWFNTGLGRRGSSYTELSQRD